MDISKVNKEFVTTLHNFVNDIYNYTGNEGAREFIEAFDKLIMDKLIRRFCEVTGKYGDAINENNETIFNGTFKILPGIDMADFWSQLTTKQKGKMWIYLNILYMSANLLNQETDMESENSCLSNSSDLTTLQSEREGQKEKKKYLPIIKKDGDNVIAELGFNPYTGIGITDTSLSVSDIYSQPTTDEETTTMDISKLTKSLGLDKMLKLDSLVQKLKEIEPDEIDNATQNLKNVMKSNENDKTSGLIADIIGDVAKELKSDKLDSENPLDNIVRIAEKVSKNMGKRMSDDGITAESMLSLAQNLSNKCGNGNNNGIDPMKMFSSLFSNLQKANSSDANTSSDILKQCTNVLHDMHMPSVD